MSDLVQETSEIAPLRALCADSPGVLAVVVGTDGPAYRAVGATMAFLADERRVGSLSSGCIEDDLALQATAVLDSGTPKTLRYGAGSAFFDLQLPCGGALDVLLVPVHETSPLRHALSEIDARRPCALAMNVATSQISVQPAGTSGWEAEAFHISLQPELHMAIFGNGVEAITFAAMARAAGYLVTFGSPEAETLKAAQALGCATLYLQVPESCPPLTLDPFSAAVLFFHDHDWEPAILARALETDAFFIGAQGSKRTHQARCLALEALGVVTENMARLRGPIGLIPSSRDPRTLAISVLADVVAAFGTK